VKDPARWLSNEEWKTEPLTAKPSSLPEAGYRCTMEDAVAQYARVRIWSRFAPVSDPSQAPPELMAKYGMLPDARKLPKEAA
jgi:hypothetical protein